MPLDLEKIDLGSFGLNEEEKLQDQFNANMAEAVKVNPDQHAQTTNLSKQSGVPEFAVQSDPEQIQQKLKLDQINIEGMTERSPVTSKFISNDVNNSIIAQEDVIEGLLEGIEETFSGIGKSIKIGFDIQGKGLLLSGNESTSSRIDDLIPASAMPIGMEFAAQQLSREFAANAGIETDEQLAEAKQQSSDRLIAEIQELQKERQTLTPEDLNIVQEGVRAGVESLANMAPGFALTVLSGGRTAPLLVTIGAQTFTSSYAEGRAEGLTPEEAQWFASIDAVIEVGTELLPTGTLERIITGKSKGVTKEALKFVVQEMGTEQLATLLQTVNSFMFGLDEQLESAQSAEEIINIQLRRQAVTAIATVVAGGSQIAAATAVNKTINKLVKTESDKETQGDVEQRNLDKLNSDSEKSKLRDRDTESFKQFIREADGENNTHVFIDGAQTSLYLQSKTREEIEEDPALKVLANATNESRATGADVAVKIDDFTGDIAGTEHFTELRDHMTMSDESISPFRQEQHREETQNYVETLMAEAQENASEYVEAQEIFTQVRDQLIDTGTVNAANASTMAQVIPAWATAQARRTGQSVAEVYESSGLIIEGPQTGERARLEGEQVLTQDPFFGEDNRLTNINPGGGVAQAIKNENPDVDLSSDTVTVYRATIGDELRFNDFVALNRNISEDHLDNLIDRGEENAVIISKEVPLSDLMIANDATEFVYVPEEQQPVTEEQPDPDIFQQKKPDTGKARGYYDPENSIIRLTESADLSTFLHEFAHFMYEMEAQGNTDINQSINNWYKRNAEDVAKEATNNLNGNFDPLKQGERTTEKPQNVNDEDVVNYLDTGSTGSRDKDNAVRRAVHEQFARGFETYLMEGKSPSIELRNAFRAFARWLAQIYQALRGDLNVKLDKEMREVFDRLLATEDQIAAAESRARIEPMFTNAAMAGMTETEFDDYQTRQEKVKDIQSETLRDKMIKQITRKTKQWWKEEKADLVDEELDRLNSERVYLTANRLRSAPSRKSFDDIILDIDNQITNAKKQLNAKRTSDEDAANLTKRISDLESQKSDIESERREIAVKLDHATVKEMVGEERTDKLGRKSVIIPDKLRGMTAKGQKGVHPDEAAAFFGYNSGSEMLNDLVTAPAIKATAESNAESRMVERHGEIFTDGTIEQQADEAVQNEERGKLILHELKIISRGTNQRTLDRQTIKSIAEERIGQLSFREIHPGKYRKAEIRAAQEASRMLATGNREGAAQSKARQVLNYYLGIAATEAKNETTKIIDRMARYNKKKVREEIQKAKNGYWEQIVKILERFEFRKSVTLASVDQINPDINTWSRERMDIDGDGLVLHNAVLNESYITHWKNITFSDLQGVNESVKNIEHVALYSNKITVLQEQVDFAKLVASWTDHMKEQDQRFATKSTRSRLDDAREASSMETLRRWASQLSKMPVVASWLDGGERAGMSHQILNQRFTDALNDKLNMMDETARPVFDAIMNRDAEALKRHNRKIFIPEIDDHLMGHQILAVALNTGNEGNLRKLLLGEKWANPDDDTTVNFQNPKLQAVLAHMNKSDWQMVQLIWDQMDSLYPQLAEVHRRTTGLVPPKVESTPVETPFGTFNGGYYPVKYSRKRSHKAEKNAEKLEAETESMFNNTASIQASVNTGATNERTGFYDAIHLSLDVVPDHFNETIHYITHHDAVRQVNKLINNNDVADAVTGSLGEAEFNQMKTWLNNIAKDGRQQPVKTYIDEIFQRLRFGTTLSIMGFKASTGIMQLFGIMTTSAELGLGPTIKGIYTTVGRSWYMKAIRRTLGSTDDMQSAWDFAAEKSKIMNHRVQTMDREIRNAMDRLTKPKLVSDTKLGKALGVFDKIPYLRTIQEVSMKHIALIQTYMIDLPTWIAAYDKSISEFNDETKAVNFADLTVETTQGSGATKDMSTLLQNQNKVVSTLTMFMTFFSSLGALSRDLVKGARKGVYSPTTVAAKVMFLFTLPVFMEALMRGELGEPEDEDDRLSKLVLKTALYPIQSVPFMRDVASGLIGDFGYNPSPVFSMLEKGIAGYKQISERSFTDEDYTKTAIKNAAKLTGAVLGLPGTSQAWATGEHLYDVIEEGEELTTGELIFGPERK